MKKRRRSVLVAQKKKLARMGFKGKGVNLSRVDPTRTVTLRRDFATQIKRAFGKLKLALVKLMIDEDAFGLKKKEAFTFNTFDEDAHPRDADGKFSDGEGGSNSASKPVATKLSGIQYQAEFKHKGERFEVNMFNIPDDLKSGRTWAVVFGIGKKDDVFLEMSKTGKAGTSAISIFRQVGKAIDGFIEKESPPRFHFTAEKIVPSRVKLYDKLSQVLAQRHGYKLTHDDTNVERRYIFDKENTPTKNVLYTDFYTDFDLAINADWQFKSDPEQIKAFQEWLKSQFKSFITSQTQEQLWDLYIEQGFRKGAGRSFDDVTASEKEFGPSMRGDGLPGSSKMDFYKGSKAQFLQDSFAQPVSRDRLAVLAGRSFDELEGVTGDMSTKISRHLTDGLVQGMSPREIARKMADEVDIGRNRALVIARTEIIRAHAEGQLTSLENLGVEEVGVSVEWSTTGDEKVCDLCEPLEGIVLKIEEARGMLPRHPNCRCAWIPAGVGEDGENQKDTKRSITKAIGLSQKRGNSEDDEEGWGPGAKISRSRPQSILNSRITSALLAFSESILNTFNPDQPRDESGKFTSVDAFHGSKLPNFEMKYHMAGRGGYRYWTATEEHAKGYAGDKGTVIRRKLNITKPLDLMKDSGTKDLTTKETIDIFQAKGIDTTGIEFKSLAPMWRQVQSDGVKDKLREHGFDAIILSEKGHDKSYFVFEDTQIDHKGKS